MSIDIAGALRWTDEMLERGFEAKADIIRASLLARLARGEKEIPIGKCNNFDPVTGCRGHGNKRKSKTEMNLVALHAFIARVALRFGLTKEEVLDLPIRTIVELLALEINRCTAIKEEES